MCTGVLSHAQSGWCMMLTTHAHLAPNLRIRKVVPLLPLHDFMALREIT